MADTGVQNIAPPSNLERPMSRQAILFTGKLYAGMAAVFAIIGVTGATGWFLLFWSTGGFVIVEILMWLCIFSLFAGLFGVSAREYLGRARQEPDLWLRIGPEGIELVQAVFRIRQHRLAWSELERWSLLRHTGNFNVFQIKSVAGKYLVLNPMEYVWTGADLDKSRTSAMALGRDIEALLGLYAKDRQGKTVR